MSQIILQSKKRISLVEIIARISEFATGGLSGRVVFLNQAGLDRFHVSFDLSGASRTAAGALVYLLESHRFLEERPPHHALGALCEYMIEHIPEQSQRDKQFLAELVVKYGLIKDAAYIQQLRTRFNITMEPQPTQSELPALSTQPATSSARKSSGIPATLLADIRLPVTKFTIQPNCVPFSVPHHCALLLTA